MAEFVTCGFGCKRTAELPENGGPPPGWDQAPITNRWRCPACWRELDAANSIPGTPSMFTPDPLPPESIGALKKLPEPLPLHEKVKP